MISDKVNTQIGSTTFDGKRRIEFLRGPSLKKLTAYPESADHHIHFEPSAPTEITKGVQI